MTDILFIAITLAFIAVCVAYVRWCDRIIGPDDFGTPESDGTTTGAATAPAPAPAIDGHGDRTAEPEAERVSA